MNGLNFVSLLYQSSALCVPIAAELIEKTQPHTDPKTGQEKFKSPLTNNEHLRRMLTTAHNQVRYRYLLADSAG